MTHNAEMLEAAPNVIATMRRLIGDLGNKPISPRALRATACEFRVLADYLDQVADEAEAGQRYAEPVESEGGLL